MKLFNAYDHVSFIGLYIKVVIQENVFHLTSRNIHENFEMLPMHGEIDF